ncbi:tRNA glutamyl-Q(34) synthetase GluQRS [Ectothiorhodospiraceae bacterium 2226]|nr:tRNA glutamyl-Q(34) synthetase GluQRS [Ectothiorhodospiraceae bacterium 2226]
MDANAPYCGRFAPSPTGPLHFGSLVTALGSYLRAHRAGGRWLVRMEDLDRPRCVAGAADDILRTLEAYGFEWDGAVLYQGTRDEAYRAALEALARQGAVYGCACSRKDLAGQRIYPGTCRAGVGAGRTARAVRVRTEGSRVCFHDVYQGRIWHDVEHEAGDFVLRRADGYFAYQLAVVVDDAEQGVTEVVRGADLLGSTPRQIHLQGLLGLATPRFAHLPVVVNAAGEKLSKQTHAPPIERARAAPTLWQALRALGQPVPEELAEDLAEVWAWARASWEDARVPRNLRVDYPAPPDA